MATASKNGRAHTNGQAAPSLRVLKEQVERQRLDLLANALTAQKKLLESQLYDTGDYLDPRGPYNDSDGFWLPVVSEQLPVSYDSRKRGENVQVYITEWGLKAIRDSSRRLAAFNEFAIAGHDNRISYIVGKGLQYRAVPKQQLDRLATKLALRWAPKVQRVIDDFSEANDWASLEQELVMRCDRDGEAFLRFFPQRSGVSAIRVVEPEHVKSATGSNQADTSFGVWTDPKDIETRLGYSIWDEPSIPPREHTPANQILHIRLNTQRNVKRGLPTWFPVMKNLKRAESLQQNMTTLVQIRAAIAMIRKHQGSSPSAIADMVSNAADMRTTNSQTGRITNYQTYRPGTIIDASDLDEYEFPSINAGIADVEIGLKCELRSIAARLIMPEWMLTANAADMGAYTSSMVAESPSVRNFQRLQAFYRMHFGAGTYNRFGRNGVMWRAIDGAIDAGLLPEYVRQLFEIEAECPKVEVRNKAEDAQSDQAYLGMRIKSPQTIANELGLDYEAEQQNFQEHDEANPQMGGQLQLPPDEQARRGGEEPEQGNLFGGGMESWLESQDADGVRRRAAVESESWDEHAHKRDHGKFSSTGGAATSPPDSSKARKTGRLTPREMAGAVAAAAKKHVAATYDDFKGDMTAEFAKLPKPVQRTLTFGHAIARKLEMPFQACQKLAKQVAVERGLSPEHAKKVGRLLAIADATLQWTVAKPLMHQILHTLGMGEAASIAGSFAGDMTLPVASLSYVAYSTARNPLATIRAAHKLVTGKLKATHEGIMEGVDHEAVAALLERLEANGGDEWYLALVHAALDKTGDLAKAVQAADAAYAQQPEQPE